MQPVRFARLVAGRLAFSRLTLLLLAIATFVAACGPGGSGPSY
jgi:hypothetical protein